MGLERLLEETPEAYYWIGFLMADGSFGERQRKGYNHKQYELSLTISMKDKIHIRKFAGFIDSKTKVYKSVGGYKPNTNYIRVFKQDNLALPEIMKKFNINVQKTENPPIKLNIKNDDLFISMIIGFIDGDGSIDKYSNTLKIECHEHWQSCLQKWFNKLWKLSKCEIQNNIMKLPDVKINKRLHGNFSRISISNFKFVTFLKQKAIKLNVPYLKRKWDRIKYKRCLEDLKQKTMNKRKEIMKYLGQGKSRKETSKLMGISLGCIDLTRRINCVT